MVSSVSSAEDDGRWQETRTTKKDMQETVTSTRTVTITREGTMETKVKTVIKRCTRSTKTTLRTPQECSPSVTQSPAAISPSSTFPSRKPQSSSTFVISRPSAPRTSTSRIAVIPHPSDLPKPTSKPEGFYLVIIGQEVGIFYTWKDTALRVLEISGAVYYKCRSFQQALADYTVAYDKGELRPIPIPGGPFWPMALRTPSPAPSEGEQSYWAQVDDLSEVLGQVQLSPTGNHI